LTQPAHSTERAAAEALGVDGPSRPAPLAAQSLLLDVTAAGSRLVAVGDRGHILLSDDQGRAWRQVPTPTRAALTAVHFPDPRHGWAVGHLGTVLRTADSGETWERCDAGLDRENVVLDVLFLNASEGFIVGAYGLLRHTLDGGNTWEKSTPQSEQYHLNRLVRSPDGALLLAGEAGTLLRSTDGARTWQPVRAPYDGSFFGIVGLPDGVLLAHGLRGHVFRSVNGGAGWRAVPTPAATLLMSGARLRSGLIVLAGQSGNFFVSSDSGQSFSLWRPELTTGVAQILETTDNQLLIVGEKGARRLAPPALAELPTAP